MCMFGLEPGPACSPPTVSTRLRGHRVCLQQSVCPHGPRPPATRSPRDSVLPTTSGTKARSVEVPKVSEKRPLSG